MLELLVQMGILKIAVKVLSISTLLGSTLARNAFESLHNIPHGWEFSREGDPNANIRLRLSLKQQNVNIFLEDFLAISTPGHAKYGQHFEGHEIRRMLKPTDETSNMVLEWLQQSGISSIQDDGDYVQFQTTVENAGRMMNTRFNFYRHIHTGEKLLRILQYSVLDEVASHINFIQPTTTFGVPRRQIYTSDIIDEELSSTSVVCSGNGVAGKLTGPTDSKVLASCNLTITPKCLHDLYKVHYKPETTCSNTIGYASFVEEYARYTDLAKFDAKYLPHANGTTQNDSGEANLDQQYALATGYPISITEFSTGGRDILIPDGASPTLSSNTNEPYLTFLLSLLALTNNAIQNSISISYGEPEQEVPAGYASQVCSLFAELGARGKSVIVSSGDSGDSGTGEYCLSNDGTNTTRFMAVLPASCPPAVRMLLAWAGRGFSNLFPRPSYQTPSIPLYLSSLGSLNAGLFNSSGRGFPDIAMQSQNYRIFNQNVEIGTCCREADVGAFFNPWTYEVGEREFRDVVEGGSRGCDGREQSGGALNGGPVIEGASWNAMRGWDPVTGFGTPDFEKLLQISTPGVKNEGGVL
ncbi:putative Tripeptidyl-peptidase sed2 [Calycina marina]|uniref:Tripeptidyl-peptidase sed2 n=1 Tax=Calycina marina TaxID=1763456 RepID=A0A9P8CDG9_9HELO|nr:putative Tripeptidyl-peptidase sed2 [Calycina marina]